MKSIGVTLQRIYLTKNCKKNIVRHPAKLSNILGKTKRNRDVTSKCFISDKGNQVPIVLS